MAKAWLCPSDSSLLVSSARLSLSAALYSAAFFLSLICDMVGSALVSAYGLLSHKTSLMRIFVNTARTLVDRLFCECSRVDFLHLFICFVNGGLPHAAV